ncbi:MAG TPA: caspase family protein [Thermoanaerobaculia bacterium]|nr:caspase family protein [Thermoanaerobaculia bacterium]
MTKRAVLVGIDTYPRPADPLRAAVKESINWDRILRTECEFDQVTVLNEEKATRLDVLRELRSLFSNAQVGDHLVFGFFGHGGKARGWDSDTVTNDNVEHALICYAGENSTGNFQQAALTPSDVARILKEKEPLAGVIIVVDLDCCFAAKFAGRKFDAPSPINPTVLFIEDAVPGVADLNALTFDAIAAMVADKRIAAPIILAASLFDQPAHEVGPDNARRLDYSYHLQEKVEEYFPDQDLTYATAIAEINPISDVQCAAIAGNANLENEMFGGGFATQSLNPAVMQVSALEAAKPHTTAAVNWLNVRLYGLLCLTNLTGKEPYRNRIIAPYDNWGNGANMHHSFVEVADRDLLQDPSGLPTNEYVRNGIKYSRWQLNRHRVTFENVQDTGMPVERSAMFDRHVPSLPKVTPILDPLYPRQEAREPNFPDPTLFSAFFDVQCGEINVSDPADLERHRTVFKKRYTHTTTWGPEYTPISVLLRIPLASDYAVVTIEDRPSHIESALFVKSGSTIAIGNARELDINGPGSGEGPREHFLIYYLLAPEMPLDPGLPETVQVPINACTVTDWP